MEAIKKKWMQEMCADDTGMRPESTDIYVFGGIITGSIAFVVLSFIIWDHSIIT